MLAVKNLSKSFGNEKILDGINLKVPNGKITAILGPNGCGKTTLLRILGGILGGYKGSIKNAENSGLIFQDLALFEWMSVRENLSFVVNDKNRIEELLSFVNLKEVEHHYPGQLSGGMRQKLAIARTLAANHSIILMDEPFSALDMQTRERFQSELESIFLQTNKTILLVTHDINEAIFVADKIIILSDKPTKVKMVIDINFPRPRRQELRNTEEYNQVRKDIWKNLMEV